MFGPAKTTTHGGAKYLLTFTEDYTRWIEIFLIKEKFDVADKFVEFKNYSETHTGKKIKFIWSGNGDEFKNTGLDQILIDVGIKRQLTVSRTPQQNGVSERKNRTFMELTRTNPNCCTNPDYLQHFGASPSLQHVTFAIDESKKH